MHWIDRVLKKVQSHINETQSHTIAHIASTQNNERRRPKIFINVYLSCSMCIYRAAPIYTKTAVLINVSAEIRGQLVGSQRAAAHADDFRIACHRTR